MKYLYLKLLNVKRVFGFTHRKLLMSLGKRIKGKRFMNILRYTSFFEILENAESINSIYPRVYIKFEDIMMFSNVFHKFKFPIIRYTSSQETVRTMLNNFKLSPNTSINNERIMLRIYKIITLIIKKKYNYDLNELRKDKKYFHVYEQNKSEHILNDIKIKPIVDQYLSQLIGFIKMLTDMRFTNFFFLRNFYIFIKFYAVTGDLDYSTNSSLFYLASRNYLNFILNSIIEFENFKKFMEKIKRNNNIKKYPIDHFNFYTECYAVDDIKTYVFIPEDKEKLNKYYQIMAYDINSFYKNYLLIDLFYDDLDIKNLDTYYQKIENATDYNIGPTSDIYIPGGRKRNRVIPNSEVETLNKTVQNYIYLEKFLDRTNIPSIPFVDFNIVQDINGVSFNFTNRATTPPFYKENILDQFDIIGKSIVGKYYQKVKCSFVTYPFNLYYWFVLNPGKPRVETVGKVGLIKESDLMSKTDEEKELELQKLDEQLVEDLFKEEVEEEEDIMEEDDESLDDTSTSETGISELEFEDDLTQVGKDSKTDEDSLSYVSAASDLSTGSFESVASEASNASTVIPGSAASNASTATLGSATSNASTATLGSATSNESTATLQSDTSSGSTISGSTTSVNFLQTANKKNSDWEKGIFQAAKESEKRNKSKQTNGLSFLQKSVMNPLPFVDTMIDERNSNMNKENYGYFNRPYNMYVNKTNILRNFSVIMKIVHTIISLNKFSVVSPVEIIKKGLSIMKGKNKFIKNHHLNPFINKMLLDINEVVQKLKSSSEKGFIGSRTDIISLYRIVEFQLFNEFLIYPPLKRLTDRELRYVLQVINEGYAFHIMKVKSKLNRELVVKEKIVRLLNTLKEYRNLFDDTAIDRLVQMFQESLDCKDIKCFDLLFNNFITYHYNNIIMRVTNKSETFNVLGEIFKNPAALSEVRVQVHETYIEPSRGQNAYENFQIESNVVLHPRLTYNELLFSSLELSKKIEIWNS
ncbi:hypothetical protein PCYB_147630, partial [Plasmodium cynomolgi strain B]